MNQEAIEKHEGFETNPMFRDQVVVEVDRRVNRLMLVALLMGGVYLFWALVFLLAMAI
ncbi:MAG: hypothetical protein ACE5G7_00635 [Candidatus Hydrothermarchaeaceae archaeon]